MASFAYHKSHLACYSYEELGLLMVPLYRVVQKLIRDYLNYGTASFLSLLCGWICSLLFSVFFHQTEGGAPV